MPYYSKKLWNFKSFQKSKAKHKKYAAILENKQTGAVRTLNFGDTRFQQYKDSTGLGLYSNLNHGDKKRRSNYRARHAKDIKPGYYSSGQMAYDYLW